MNVDGDMFWCHDAGKKATGWSPTNCWVGISQGGCYQKERGMSGAPLLELNPPPI